MQNTQLVASAAAFLIALFAGSFVYTTVQPSLGQYGSGVAGFIISGLFMFGAYILIVRHWHQAEPT